MGILNSLLQTLSSKPRPPKRGAIVQSRKMRRIEHLEQRQMLAADLLGSPEIIFGATYFEEATGDDSAPDVIQVSFEGGAIGTTLNRIVINGDKQSDGPSVGDVFFDTSSGGLGAFESVGLTIVSHDGFDIDGFTVVDGGSQIVFHASGWDAGERLVFSIDVDEYQFFDTGAIGPDGSIADISLVESNALAEGGEFQRSILIGDFTATGYEDITLSTVFWDDFDGRRDTAESATGLELDLPDDRYSADHDFTDRTAGAVVHAPQVLLPTIEGTVFHDVNLDNDQDPGDLGIAGVELALWQQSGDTYVDTGMRATTDADGHYVFCDGMNDVRLLPGTYQVREAQPEPYFSVGADAGRVGEEPRGSVLNVDTITAITVASGEHSIENDFAESLPAAISGYVFVDYDDDGHYDAGIEPGIAGVTIQVIALETVNGSTGVRTITTNEQGYYEATGLVPGRYRVVEVIQPAPYFDGRDEAGTVEGTTVGAAVNPGDEINGIFLGGGQEGIQYNFGELPPGSIGGRIHLDPNADCDWDNPETMLEGVVVDLLDSDGNLIATTTTNSDGEYLFTGLARGIYQVREHQPSAYYDGGERIGTAGGESSDSGGYSLISGIDLGVGQQATEYDFCEFVGATLSGYVYHDQSNDGSFDRPGEAGIGGVVLKLMDADGNDTGLRATTDDTGFYQFTNLDAGTYCVMEVHPAGWLDGIDTPGSHGGTADNPSPGDMICDVTINYGDDAIEYNFGELLPASIAGRVHASTGPDCDFDNPEILLAGVQIDLLDPTGNVVATTLTNVSGEYEFTGLRPGEYQIREHQPSGYYDGDEHVGTAGGDVADDLISAISLGSGVAATQYDFCEHVGVNLSGYVYHDRSNDGSFDRPGEEGIGGVTLKLLDGDGNDTGLRAVTDANGHYQFTNLAPGTYCVMEIHPDGWIDGIDTPGSHGGTADNPAPGDMICEITLNFGDDAVEYNFGELLPGSIAGQVHVTTTPDCEPNSDYPPISGVTIELLDGGGNVIATTMTDADGRYQFDGLPPGHYSVREVQPADYFDAGYHIGSGSGSFFGANHMGDILVGSDQHLVEYDFCEMPPAQLSGYVFIDGAPIMAVGELPADISSLRNGQRTSDDTPLANIVIELRDGTSGDPIFAEDVLPGIYPPGPLRTTTDASGYYEFTGLPGGTYAVVEVHPEGLIDGIDTQGSLGGFAINPLPSPLGPQVEHMTEVESQIIAQFRLRFGNDAIVQIPLAIGQNSVENNFSEVSTTTFWFPPETPPETPPPVFFGPPAPLPPVYDPLFRFTRVVVEQYDSAGQISGWTWHLSVVNGGQPRSARIDEASRVLLSMQSIDTVMIEQDMDRAEWLRLTGEEIDGEQSIESLVFGNPDARPVSGDWDGDGREEMGVFLNGHWLLDLNGNGVWDAGDLYAQLGSNADLPTTGDWDGDGKTDIAIFGPAWPGDPHHIANEPGLPDAANYPALIAGKMKNMPPMPDEATLGARTLRLAQDGTPRADLIDHVFNYGARNDWPIAGDWNGDGVVTIGVYNGGNWLLDVDGDGVFTGADLSIAFGDGSPVVGDWNGDGIDDIGTYAAGRWTLDSNGDRMLDARDQVFEMGGDRDQPVAGDWNGDGRDEPAVYHPSQGREIRVSQRAG